jgi:hypothetical protein
MAQPTAAIEVEKQVRAHDGIAAASLLQSAVDVATEHSVVKVGVPVLVDELVTTEVPVTDEEVSEVVTVEDDDVVVTSAVHGVVGFAVTHEHNADAPFNTSIAVVPGHELRTAS